MSAVGALPRDRATGRWIENRPGLALSSPGRLDGVRQDAVVHLYIRLYLFHLQNQGQ
ncbi:hypothetical protein D3C87_987020 [compost metagenome]